MLTSRIRLWLSAAACLPFCGCIGGEIVSYTRYDESSDSFSFLELYVNIETDKAAELDHIARLYERRDTLIITGFPHFKLFSSPRLLERHGKHSYSSLPLAEAMTGEPERLTTAVDLDSIEIMPGEFFLNEHRNLSYYHQVVIPGKAVDAAMREQVPQIAAELAKLAREQRRLAAKAGSRKLTWDEVRRELRQGLGHDEAKPEEEKGNGQTLLPLDAASFCVLAATDEDNAVSNAGGTDVLTMMIPLPLEDRLKRLGADGNQEDGQELLPLDSTSLHRLIMAGVDKWVQFTRKGDSFTLLVPLSERDCVEALETIELVRKLTADRLAAGKDVEEELADVLEAVEVRHVEGSGLQVTFHGTKFWERTTRRRKSMPAPKADKEAVYRSTVAGIRERGIEVNGTDLFPTILRRFFEKDR
ncbi:MAG: hypothetical protein RBS80_21085 [Thermoguttaceae bacterium]|jgi:hypothetical protein|nr:hypothetical protein [Thermoguttaceae bacterium]